MKNILFALAPIFGLIQGLIIFIGIPIVSIILWGENQGYLITALIVLWLFNFISSRSHAMNHTMIMQGADIDIKAFNRFSDFCFVVMIGITAAVIYAFTLI